MTGEPLFADADLGRLLVRRTESLVRDAVFEVLLLEPGLSCRDLRRTALAAIALRSLSLGEPQLSKLSAGRGGSGAPFGMYCLVPFDGDRWLFGHPAPIWPPMRRVFGALTADNLLLQAEGWSGDEPYLSAVIASELAEVERMLTSQRKFMRRAAAMLDVQVRNLVDLIYPRIYPEDLKQIRLMLSLATKPRLQQDAIEAAASMQRSLWRRWTRP